VFVLHGQNADAHLVPLATDLSPETEEAVWKQLVDGFSEALLASRCA
jgi:hypothetical protein